MSNAALNWAIEQQIDDPVAKCILICLANRLNGKTGRLDPSIEQICRDCGGPRSTVMRKLQWLVANGFLEKTRHGPRTNSYVLKSHSETSNTDTEKSHSETSNVDENPVEDVSNSHERCLKSGGMKSHSGTSLYIKPEEPEEPEGNGTGFSNQVPVAESESSSDIFSPSAAAAPSRAMGRDGSPLPEGEETVSPELARERLWRHIRHNLPDLTQKKLADFEKYNPPLYAHLRREATATGNQQAGVALMTQKFASKDLQP